MSGKTANKPAATTKGSHIQMFLDDDDKHFIDVINETTYDEMLLNGGRKHSEFMQPFLSTDYPGMDYLWPDTPLFGDLPGGVNTSLITQTGGGGTAGASGYNFQCIISCEPLVTGSMCNTTDPLKCYYGAVTGGGSLGGWVWSDAPADFAGIKFVEGSGVSPVHAISGSRPSKKWKYLSAEDDYWITIIYHDSGSESAGWYYHPIMGKWIYINPGNSTCYYNVYVNCPACPADVELSFNDDDTPDTIDPDSTIAIRIQDGLGPYTWSTISTGYSLGSLETTGYVNSLSCVDGDCDVDFDPYAAITVVDSCDDVVNFNIRNTAGQWVEKEEITVTMSGNCTGYANCTPATADEYSENIYKWTLLYLRCWAYSVGKSCASNWNGGSNWPPCGDSMPCGSQYCESSCVSDEDFNRFKMATRYQYYEWEC